jgi:hypothetical protein
MELATVMHGSHSKEHKSFLNFDHVSRYIFADLLIAFKSFIFSRGWPSQADQAYPQPSFDPVQTHA